MSNCNQATIADTTFRLLRNLQSLKMHRCCQQTITDDAIGHLTNLQYLMAYTLKGNLHMISRWKMFLARISAPSLLLIEPFGLIPGVTYLLEYYSLYVSSQVITSSKIEILVNTPPECGVFEMFDHPGVVTGVTEIMLGAPGWQDEDRQLLYAFLATRGQTTTICILCKYIVSGHVEGKQNSLIIDLLFDLHLQQS